MKANAASGRGGGFSSIGSSLPGGGSAFGGDPRLIGDASIKVSVYSDIDKITRQGGM